MSTSTILLIVAGIVLWIAVLALVWVLCFAAAREDRRSARERPQFEQEAQMERPARQRRRGRG